MTEYVDTTERGIIPRSDHPEQDEKSADATTTNEIKGQWVKTQFRGSNGYMFKVSDKIRIFLCSAQTCLLNISGYQVLYGKLRKVIYEENLVNDNEEQIPVERMQEYALRHAMKFLQHARFVMSEAYKAILPYAQDC